MAGQQRRGWLVVGSAAAAGGLLLAAGCANDSLTVVRLDEADLQRLARERFPRQQRLFEVLDVTFEPPTLKLLAASNRIGTQLAFTARERVLGLEWSGELDADAALRWDAKAQAALLSQVRVQGLKLGRGGPAPLTDRFSRYVAEQMLEGMAVWRPNGEQAERLRKHGLVPSAVTVTSRGVEITLVPGTLGPAPTPAARPDVQRPAPPPRPGSV
jgi:hypothetical protein